MKQILLICGAMVLLGCGKKAPEQQAEPKVELTEAKEYWEKAYAICSEKLGPNHPNTESVKGQLDALKE